MSCPDWQSLSDRRHAGVDEDPVWEAALAHHDGCRRCREAALRAEPTLLFRRLPALTADDGAIADMKRAVADMRRIEPIEKRRRRPSSTWLQAAALAGLLLGAATLQGPRPMVVGDGEPALVARAATAPAPTAVPGPLTAEATRVLEQMPLVESADPFFEPIIQFDEEISLVVVSLPGSAGARNLGV